MFTEEQNKALSAPLDRKNVKSRTQGGRGVSYVEGWHAIAEANRIFGFGAWSRQTLELKCVTEAEREIGRDKAKGWGVTYIARVRVAVGDVIRDGSGTGHGIDRDLGQAHESALKEAETDAMKRALMTFGNPFGLALYDKEQTQVCDTPEEKPAPVDIRIYLDGLQWATDSGEPKKLEAWYAANRDAVNALPSAAKNTVAKAYAFARDVLNAPDNILKAG